MTIRINGTNTAANPGITGTDTDTGFQFGTDEVNIVTGGSTRATVDSSGRLLVGTTSSSVQTSVLLQGNSAASNSYGTLYLSRGINNPSDGQFLGEINFSDSGHTSAAKIRSERDGGTWTSGSSQPSRLLFETTADGASSPTERMRILSTGRIVIGDQVDQPDNTQILDIGDSGYNSILVFVQPGGGNSTAEAAVWVRKSNNSGRSINAAGTVNASGADYAEYMTKAGDFNLAKGDICGVNADGKLTNVFAEAISFLVKSTDPSYVGGDTWGTEEAVGTRPDPDDADALAEWKAGLEVARQYVDRIAFAGQVPVNVMGATAGQYIVPVEDNGGISGIAKNQADLTLAEYMKAVGKVIAIEDDGRARIIVKVA